MVRDEFLGIEQRPEQVAQPLALVARAGRGSRRATAIPRRRLAAEGAEIGLADERLGGGSTGSFGAARARTARFSALASSCRSISSSRVSASDDPAVLSPWRSAWHPVGRADSRGLAARSAASPARIAGAASLDASLRRVDRGEHLLVVLEVDRLEQVRLVRPVAVAVGVAGRAAEDLGRVAVCRGGPGGPTFLGPIARFSRSAASSARHRVPAVAIVTASIRTSAGSRRTTARLKFRSSSRFVSLAASSAGRSGSRRSRDGATSCRSCDR